MKQKGGGSILSGSMSQTLLVQRALRPIRYRLCSPGAPRRVRSTDMETDSSQTQRCFHGGFQRRQDTLSASLWQSFSLWTDLNLVKGKIHFILSSFLLPSFMPAWDDEDGAQVTWTWPGLAVSPGDVASLTYISDPAGVAGTSWVWAHRGWTHRRPCKHSAGRGTPVRNWPHEEVQADHMERFRLTTWRGSGRYPWTLENMCQRVRFWRRSQSRTQVWDQMIPDF